MYLQETYHISTKLLQYRMKFFLLATTAGISFAIFKEALFPNFHLTLILVLTIAIDFVSGIMKSIAANQPVISRKLRRTIFKSNMYGLIIVLSFACRSMLQGQNNVLYDFIGQLINNGVITTLIYIETLSILENLIAMDQGGPISKLLKPAHLFLSWKIKSALMELMGKQYDEQHKSE